MKARFSLRMLLAACVALISVSSLMAQTNTYTRISLIEQFTSATCGPCVAAGPVMARVVQLSNGVVSIRYHLDFPAPGDPWNVANPAENSSRQTLYGVGSIPTARVNGKTAVDPRQEQQLINQITTDNNAKSPLNITVTKTGTNVKVKVDTKIDLKAHKLQVALVSRRTVLPNLPSELQYSNGETEFGDAMLKMMPNAAGTSLSMDANTSQEFNFTYNQGNTDIWPEGQQYVIAFVQANTGREVLQAGTNLNEVQAVPQLSGVKWQYIGRGEQKQVTITVSNPGSSALETDVKITNAADLTAAGWTVALSNDVLSIPAGGSKTVTATVTGPNRASFAGIILETSPINVEDGIAKSAQLEFGFLTEGTRAAVFAGASDGAVISALASLASSYGTDIAYMPFALEILEAFNPTNLDAAIFPAGFDGRFNMVAFTPVMEAMTNAGKGVWMQAPVGLAVAFNDQNQQFPGYPESKAWFENLGLSLKSTVSRATQTQNGTQINTFQMAGVAGDPIGAGFTATANQYGGAQWPFYTTAQDLITISPTVPSFGWAYSDGQAANINAIRHQYSEGGKVVFSTWGPELIRAEASRNGVTQKVLDWLLASNSPSISLSATTLNFGTISEGATKDLTVTITNSGSAPLEISAMSLGGTDPDGFEIKEGAPASGNITVAPKGTHRVTVTFKPAFEGAFQAALEIESNVGATTSVALRGTASGTSSVETESTSPSGALALRLVGSNPVTSSTDVAFTVNGAGTDNVTVSVVDVMGRTVATLFDGMATAGTQRLSLNAAQLSAGMYTIVATNGAERTALTVISNR